MDRDDFSAKTRNALRLRAAFICSNPNCRKQTIAPADSSEDQYTYIGKAAHITAAAKGGPRYDEKISAEERSSILNAIFLCSGCADIIDKNGGSDFSSADLRLWKIEHEKFIAASLNKSPEGVGGEGGSGTIVGNRGVVIGGRGGKSGRVGFGGKGGSGYIQGDDGLIIGGDGGDCPSIDGRGGRGARGPTERFGFETFTWGYGRGGSGANHPEFNRRLNLLRQLRQEYMSKFPDDAVYIEAGIESVPLDWINQRLVECRENWLVTQGPDGYVLPPLEV